MERHLRASSSDVVDVSFRNRVSPAVITMGILVAVAGVGMLLGGIITQFPILGIVGFAAMVTGVLVATSGSGKARTTQNVSSPRGPKPKRSGPSTLDDRWNRRMDGTL